MSIGMFPDEEPEETVEEPDEGDDEDTSVEDVAPVGFTETPPPEEEEVQTAEPTWPESTEGLETTRYPYAPQPGYHPEPGTPAP